MENQLNATVVNGDTTPLPIINETVREHSSHPSIATTIVNRDATESFVVNGVTISDVVFLKNQHNATVVNSDTAPMPIINETVREYNSHPSIGTTIVNRDITGRSVVNGVATDDATFLESWHNATVVNGDTVSIPIINESVRENSSYTSIITTIVNKDVTGRSVVNGVATDDAAFLES